ncbi:hypothetical protein MCEMSE15_01396 [Fimbriimonadaceae bacterium]
MVRAQRRWETTLRLCRNGLDLLKMEQPLNPWDPSKTVRATRWILLLFHTIGFGLVALSFYRVLTGALDQWVGILAGLVPWLLLQYGFVKDAGYTVDRISTIGALRIVKMCGVFLLVHRSAVENADNFKESKE